MYDVVYDLLGFNEHVLCNFRKNFTAFSISMFAQLTLLLDKTGGLNDLNLRT